MGVRREGRAEWDEEGKGKGRGEFEGMGYSRWRKDRDESKEVDILIVGAIMGVARNLALEKFPGIHKDDTS